MMVMSLNRSFRALLTGLLILSLFSAPAMGLSATVTESVDTAAVDEQVSAEYEFTQLYRSPDYDSWVITGETDLDEVTWTVTYYDQTDSKIAQDRYTGQSFNGASVDVEDGTSRVTVNVRGDVPAVDAYTWDPMQSFVVMELGQTEVGGAVEPIDTMTATHYTPSSIEAREAMDTAAAAIAVTDAPEAERTFANAVTAYEREEFDLATNLAVDATDMANEQAGTDQRNRLILYGVVGVVLLGLVGGGIYLYLQRTGGPDRLG
jgi:hypothetical protein